MKSLIFGLFAVSVVSGCSSLSSESNLQENNQASIFEVKSHYEKYTVQILEVETPYIPLKEDLMTEGDQKPLVEKILATPDTVIHEYPHLYAVVGEPAFDDQSTPTSIDGDFVVVDGIAVPNHEKYKFGRTAFFIIHKEEKGNLWCRWIMSNQKFWGFKAIQLADGSKVNKPVVTGRGLNTKLLLQPNSWASVGGLKKQSAGGQEMELMYFVRVIPPDENIYKDSNQELHFTVNNARF